VKRQIPENDGDAEQRTLFPIGVASLKGNFSTLRAGPGP
jgi:hypothetical protein